MTRWFDPEQSRENLAVDLAVLPESLVECHQFQPCGPGESRQIRVVPHLGRERTPLCVLPPVRFDSDRLRDGYDLRILRHLILQQPRILQRDGVVLEYRRIRCQAEKALLRQTAEGAPLTTDRLEPRLCGRVVKVDLERQRQPDVNVRKKHLRHPGLQRFSRRSTAGYPDGWTGPEERSLDDRPSPQVRAIRTRCRQRCLQDKGTRQHDHPILNLAANVHDIIIRPRRI